MPFSVITPITNYNATESILLHIHARFIAKKQYKFLMPPPPATQSSSRGEGGVKLKLCLRRNWCGRKCGTGAYLGSEAENKVLLFHVDKRTYCHFNTILCYLLPRNASVASFNGYSICRLFVWIRIWGSWPQIQIHSSAHRVPTFVPIQNINSSDVFYTTHHRLFILCHHLPVVFRCRELVSKENTD